MNRRLVLLAAVLLSMAALGRPGAAPGCLPESTRKSSEASVIAVGPGGPAEEVLLLFNEFMARYGDAVAPQPGAAQSEAELARLRELMTILYPGAAKSGADAHKTVALLISQGLSEAATSEAFNTTFREKGYKHRQISDAMSLAMSEARDRLIEQSIIAVARQEGWMIGRSDSGNPKSGMRSDLDQTLYVFRLDPESGEPVRDESLDATFIQKFEDHWAAHHGDLGLRLLDVVSIGGKNRFPDPRSTSVHVEFQRAYHGTLAELRNTPGAYTTYGAVMQQVQRRMMETLEALQRPENAGLWREKGRIWQEYGPDPDQPGTYGKRKKPNFERAARSMFFAPADLLPDSALGAAVANFLELQHYMHEPKFNTKYHLRTFDDALFSLHLLEQGRGLKDKIDYSAMGLERRRHVGAELLTRVFPGDAAKQRQHLLALEISCDLRVEHTSEKPADLMRVEAYKRNGSVPRDPAARAALIYADLARELYGAAFTPAERTPAARARTSDQVQAAEQHYRRLASELCLEAVNKTAGDALAFFTDPGRAETLFERSRPLLEKTSPAGVDWNATKQNVAESARITLLYAVYDLGAVGGARLLQRLGAETGAKNVDLVKVYLSGQFAPLSAFRANPDAYLRTWRAQTGALAERVYMHGLSEVGFVELGKARYTLDLLGSQKLVWSPFTFADKWADAALWDKGSFASLAEVARAYFTSKGEVEPIVTAILAELLGAMPVVGQIVAVTTGGLEGAVKVAIALASPTGATALIVYQIGDAAYAIYEVEVGAPARGNVVDALYRGFAGPESVAYGEPGKPPPMWTDADEAALADLRARLRAARPHPPLTPYDEMSYPERLAFHEQYARELEAYQAVAKVIEPQIANLENKQSMFAEYRDGSWSGGYMTGFSAVENQRWLSTSLLDAVTPVTAFVTSGVVDLRTPFVPERDEARISDLRARAAAGGDVEARIDAAAALHEVEIVKERWERNRRYEKHALEKSRELLYRFRRDSVFRHVQKNVIDMNAFVDDFVARNGEKLARELEKHGLLYPVVHMPPRIRGEPSGKRASCTRSTPSRTRSRCGSPRTTSAAAA